ncbi:MAG: ATP-binding cassette domain-containing protein [Streptosporangiales bacterium]|nr:ATP-binding cassette domain-containing protein [Streptosporangiales bacterium]
MLTANDVHSYYDTAYVLRGVDLSVNEGEVVALLGRNGMGKTTLVRSIAGITPPVVRRGRITWDGRDLRGLLSYQIAKRGIGLVPQGRHIFGSLTVEENLTTTARSRANGGGWDLDAVYEFFPRLAERRGSRGVHLSGGEQQMLAIARALMTNPRLLLMDEPSEGLAPIVLAQVRERIERLKGGDIAILLVEQNLGLALRLADRVYILGENGRITWHGEPDELDNDPAAKRQHLGV